MKGKTNINLAKRFNTLNNVRLKEEIPNIYPPELICIITRLHMHIHTHHHNH